MSLLFLFAAEKALMRLLVCACLFEPSLLAKVGSNNVWVHSLPYTESSKTSDSGIHINEIIDHFQFNQGSYWQVCVKFKDFSKPFKRLSSI